MDEKEASLMNKAFQQTEDNYSAIIAKGLDQDDQIEQCREVPRAEFDHFVSSTMQISAIENLMAGESLVVKDEVETCFDSDRQTVLSTVKATIVSENAPSVAWDRTQCRMLTHPNEFWRKYRQLDNMLKPNVEVIDISGSDEEDEAMSSHIQSLQVKSLHEPAEDQHEAKTFDLTGKLIGKIITEKCCSDGSASGTVVEESSSFSGTSQESQVSFDHDESMEDQRTKKVYRKTPLPSKSTREQIIADDSVEGSPQDSDREETSEEQSTSYKSTEEDSTDPYESEMKASYKPHDVSSVATSRGARPMENKKQQQTAEQVQIYESETKASYKRHDLSSLPSRQTTFSGASSSGISSCTSPTKTTTGYFKDRRQETVVEMEACKRPLSNLNSGSTTSQKSPVKKNWGVVSGIRERIEKCLRQAKSQSTGEPVRRAKPKEYFPKLPGEKSAEPKEQEEQTPIIIINANYTTNVTVSSSSSVTPKSIKVETKIDEQKSPVVKTTSLGRVSDIRRMFSPGARSKGNTLSSKPNIIVTPSTPDRLFAKLKK